MDNPSTRIRARSRLKTTISSTAEDRQRLIKLYLKHFPLLLLSFPGYLLVFWLLHSYYPPELAHWLMPNSYLPLQLPLYVSNMFLFSFLLLNTKAGSLLAMIVSILLFFHLNLVVYEFWWVSLFTVFFGVMFYFTIRSHR